MRILPSPMPSLLLSGARSWSRALWLPSPERESYKVGIPRMLKAVIFDLDGVIADSHPLHHAAWKTLLAEQGRTVNDTEMDFILAGRQRVEILRHYLGDLPEEQIAKLGKRKDELYQGRAHLLAPMPGLNTFLDELETAEIAKAVATSAGPA